MKKTFKNKTIPKFIMYSLLIFSIFLIFLSISFPKNKTNTNIENENNLFDETNETYNLQVETTPLPTTKITPILEEISLPIIEKREVFNTTNALIWPICDITIYDETYNEIGTIQAGTPLIVIEDNDTYLKVNYNEKNGLIESNKCMVNLPNVMQLEMEYDITNSYSSIYKIHGLDIENVTNEILYPYAKIDENEYLVPLLIPVAKQLFEIESQLIEKGYSLKIYDAYRPYEVTKTIYSKTMEFINNNPIYKEYMLEPINGETHALGNFLAKNVSNHNYGVAIDTTIIDLKTGEELEMQSPMHELSTRSILSLNNENANLLQEIMTSNGFTGLVSEWWHFQMSEYKINYATFQVEIFQ